MRAAFRLLLALAHQIRRPVPLAVVEDRPEALDRFATQSPRDLAVGLQRSRDLAMPQPLLHHLRMHALPEKRRRVGLWEVVESDRGQRGLLEQAPEFADDVAVHQRPAPVSGEEQVLLDLRRAVAPAIPALQLPMDFQRS